MGSQARCKHVATQGYPGFTGQESPYQHLESSLVWIHSLPCSDQTITSDERPRESFGLDKHSRPRLVAITLLVCFR